MTKEYCSTCGQLHTKEVTVKLWDIYRRADMGGRQYIEPFVYTQDELDELGFYDDEDSRDSVMASMERNMIERGLCHDCGRPDLRQINQDTLMTEEEAQDEADYYAEVAAERRAGC